MLRFSGFSDSGAQDLGNQSWGYYWFKEPTCKDYVQ